MSSLFDKKLPTLNNPQELEDVRNKHTSNPYNYDPYYVVSGVIPERRNKFNALWGIYEDCSDSHFEDQIKYDFHPRTWEMYLGATLVDNGFNIISKDEGPDIKITSTENTVWVEATATYKGNGPDAVPEMQFGTVVNVPHDEMLLRISNSLIKKFDKFKMDKQKGIIKEDEPFVIAVNVGALGYPDPDMPLIWKNLFELGYQTISVNQKTGQKSSYISSRKYVEKENGEKVPLNFFLNKDHSGISAVIYSNKDVLNHPDELGKDLIVVHNPHADNPLDESVLNCFEQYRLNGGKIERI